MSGPHATDPAADVVVVGGGISGLTAAYRLQQRGFAVQVLDAAPRPGGVIGSHRCDGFLYEAGPNSTLDSTPLLAELFADLGIAAQRRDASAVAAIRYVVRGGKLVALPTSPRAFLTTGAFSLRAKLRLAREPFVAPGTGDESIAAFTRRRLGDEFLDYAIDPFVAGIYAGDPDRISVMAAFPRLHALEQKYGSLIKGQIKGAKERRDNPEKAKNTAGSFSFAGGMQTLTDALARNIAHLASATRVLRIACDGAGYAITAETAEGTIACRGRAVVLAAPAYVASGLVLPLAPTAAQALAAIDYAPIAVAATAYRRADVAHSLAGFGFLIPKREQRTILGALFSSSMFEGRAPEGHVLVTTFVGGRRDPGRLAQDDAELASTVTREHAALIGAKAAPLWTRITRWPQAIPQYDLGHLARIAHLDAAEAALPGLHFCANYRDGVSVGDRVKAAHATADKVAQFLSARTTVA